MLSGLISVSIFVSYSVEIWYEVVCKISVSIPVCVYPYSCKAWIAWRTLFDTNFTSELDRVFTLDACSKLSSRCCRTKDGGFLISSSTWRMYMWLRKRFRTSRSFSRRPWGAVLIITFLAWEVLFLAVIRKMQVELAWIWSYVAVQMSFATCAETK